METTVIQAPRLSVPQYLRLVGDHFVRHWVAYTLPLILLAVLQLFVRLDVNLTDSLPDKVFLTVKGMPANIKKGDYIAFEYQGTGPASPFPYGFHFVKIVGGTPGDLITMDSQRNFYRESGKGTAGQTYLGTAKVLSKKGQPLVAGPVGVIPEGEYYVFAPHPDSLDSRYAMTGWVKQVHIVGKTYPLF